ncbi:MAG: rhomboid family intramembrane serine protease [Tessaracoccus sp.]|uniref:rhomboid family intramembrane serine protease n=1 Tax=Tessaracoccus sp. TaxID=1971211 RepID=UPI001ECDBF83|nr:rhomboid family intramembrane serine protease [Tessaracoccus sp.]MBK7822080.1 rhomboid family intramembrane serine protease [Tessaracoccus sp.]
MDDAAPACYRHPDRATRIFCQRCDRPICPECMVPGSVGFQCPACVTQGFRETRQFDLPYGGKRSADPRITSFVLIGLNAAVWVMLQIAGMSDRLIDTLALSPANRCETLPNGGFWPDKGVCLEKGLDWGFGLASEPWQIITNGFTHLSPMHLGFNMLVLYMLGPSLESIFGRARFLAVYLVALLGASAAVVLFSEPFTQTLGASGAIYGMIGAVLLVALKHRGNVRSILIWLGLNIALTFFWPNVSWQGHLGGFVGGLAVAAVLMYAPKGNRAVQWGLVTALAVAFVAVSFARALQLT